MTELEKLAKKVDEIKEDLGEIKKILKELYPYKTRQELLEIGKHDDLKRHDDKSGK
jgi:hypothetical protein